MKKVLYVFGIVSILSFNACGGNKDKKEPSENDMEDMTMVEDHEKSDTVAMNAVGGYGKEITKDGAISIAQLVSEIKTSKSYTGKVQGEVNACCQNKGCWMKMDIGGGETMMITFKDYGFFVPKDIPGKTVVIEGNAAIESISVEDQKHLAMDAGKTQAEIDAITQPKEELVFVADGVIAI